MAEWLGQRQTDQSYTLQSFPYALLNCKDLEEFYRYVPNVHLVSRSSFRAGIPTRRVLGGHSSRTVSLYLLFQVVVSHANPTLDLLERLRPGQVNKRRFKAGLATSSGRLLS